MLARLRTVAPIVVVLLALVVLSVRMSGAHAHRDLGAGQANVMHEHGHHEHGHHHDAHEEVGFHAHAEGQVDVEVDGLTGQADRIGKFSPLLVGLVLALSSILIASRRTVPRPPNRSDPHPVHRSHRRPQLRGPPASSIA